MGALQLLRHAGVPHSLHGDAGRGGGLGFSDPDAASIYGTYTGSVWGAAILGGIVADRFLGQYRSVLIGGIIIALGHFALAFKALPFFYSGLTLIVVGTGLLKPNVSTRRRVALRARRYPARRRLLDLLHGHQPRRVPRAAGRRVPRAARRLASGLRLRRRRHGPGRGAIHRWEEAPLAGDRAPGGAAEGTRRRATFPRRPVASPNAGVLGFSSVEWKRIGAIVILFIVASLFWGGYEQAGSTLTLFADRYTRLEIMGFSFPSSWFQTVQPICVILFAPLFAWLWIRLGPREPSVPTKFALALMFMSVSFLVLVPAGAMAQEGEGVRVSPMWLVVAYAISELGELCLSPVGLSAVSKLAPVRILGLMMGVWFLSNSLGNKLAGWAAGFISTMPLETLFSVVAGTLAVAAVVMFAVIKPIRRLMGE